MKNSQTEKAHTLSFATPLYTHTMIDSAAGTTAVCSTLYYHATGLFFLYQREVNLTVPGVATFVEYEGIGDIINLTPLQVKEWSETIGENLVEAQVRSLLVATRATLAALEVIP